MTADLTSTARGPRPRALVTGCAGFLGSHLAERLLADGCDVVGVDCFTTFYDRAAKERNLNGLRQHSRFDLRVLDLAEDALDGVLEGVDAVYHLAGQPGVRMSFGDGFRDCMRHNLGATQRLLEAAAVQPPMAFVYASSSSVYGDVLAFPTTENGELRPVSPYGLTKLAVERLADLYHRTAGLHVVGLRYFTAFGPRQRPDMAFSRFLSRALRGDEIPVFGDGQQIRDFTYVDDLIDGTLSAAAAGRSGAVYNLGGGKPIPLREVLAIVEDLVERPVRVAHRPAARGDARHTAADCSLARHDLGYRPRVELRDGLALQLAWMLASVGSRDRALAVAA